MRYPCYPCIDPTSDYVRNIDLPPGAIPDPSGSIEAEKVIIKGIDTGI